MATHAHNEEEIGNGGGHPWQQRVLDHWSLINRLASRRFPRSELAEQAALYVMDRLAEDDWRRMRTFAGRSSLATFIAALTIRLLEDFARSRFGRRKPPLWIRRLGGIWLTLFRLLCLERHPPDEAVALAADRQPGSTAALEQAAYAILGEITDCGAFHGEETALCETHSPAGQEPEEGVSLQQQRLEAAERVQLFSILGRVLFDERSEPMEPHIAERFASLAVNLTVEDRLLLKLCYRDGVAVTEAGRQLGLNRFQIHGRLRRLLERLRNEFEAAGLTDALRQLL